MQYYTAGVLIHMLCIVLHHVTLYTLYSVLELDGVFQFEVDYACIYIFKAIFSIIKWNYDDKRAKSVFAKNPPNILILSVI